MLLLVAMHRLDVVEHLLQRRANRDRLEDFVASALVQTSAPGLVVFLDQQDGISPLTGR
jgi:hypothetical protein